MAYNGEFSKDCAFNQLLEQISTTVSREINPDFYIKDSDYNGIQFRKAINREEDMWLLLIIIPKAEYHKYYLSNCKLDRTQDYCLIGNLKVIDGEDVLCNESNLYYFNKDTSMKEISEGINNIINASKEFIENLI